MEEQAATNMARSLVREAGALDRLGTEAGDRASYYLGEILTSLPDAVDSAVFPGEQDKAKGVIVADERLYIVDAEIGDPPDSRQPGRPLIRALTTARPYDSRDWTVSLESLAAVDLTQGASGFRTAWRFSYAGETVVEVRGEVHVRPEAAIDRSEAFARSLAKKVGFRVA